MINRGSKNLLGGLNPPNPPAIPTLLHTGQPCYLADLLDLYIDHLELCDPLTLTFFAVPSCSKSNFASPAFCISSPNNWYSLPLNIRSSDSLATFQSRLKSHLFASAYHL